MKKRWITWKRRWRKLDKADRLFFRGYAVLFAVNIPLCFMSPVNIATQIWLALLMCSKYWEIARARRSSYHWFRVGDCRQFVQACKRKAALMQDYLDSIEDLRKTRSDYSKLKYDYNKLRKEVRNKK